VEVRTSGQPRPAREAVNQLIQYRPFFPGSYGVFMAPYISPEAAEILKKEGIGYIDFSGNCLLSFEQIYIEQGGRPNLFMKRRDLRSLYSPRAERVLRVLLSNPKRVWKLKDLAAEARVSLGQSSNVKKLLRDREWVRIEPGGLVLSEPDRLLGEWVGNYSFRRNRVSDFYSGQGIPEVEIQLAESCRKKGLAYALTSFSGAARLAPAVGYERAMAYVEETDEDPASLFNLKQVRSGANVSLLTPYDDGVFYNISEVDGLRIVSPIQIYLDLMSFRGPGEAAAATILEEVIRSFLRR
jgi:hypothetical protein